MYTLRNKLVMIPVALILSMRDYFNAATNWRFARIQTCVVVASFLAILANPSATTLEMRWLARDIVKAYAMVESEKSGK